MEIKSDIQIAQEAKLLPISEIAARAGIAPENLDLYGSYKAKIKVEKLENKPPGKLILVTAINPTPAGEGKTTTSVGLADALSRLGKKTMLTLREPSLGPVFGLKGGAAGGGYAQVVPMEDINLHFTGDIHAVTAANNLLAAMIDNHIYHGNRLRLDPRQIKWRRCLDMNDRQLRNVVGGLGGRTSGMPREDSFDITVASEVMAALCLAGDIVDLKERLGNILIGYSFDDKPVFAGEIKANGAMAALLKEAVKPNLVQTLEYTPTIIHGGPFANIAHGCNSLIATKTAMSLADYTVTEAGFGADLGAEKFIDIKCRAGGIRPDAVVIVASVKALKYNGGADKSRLAAEDLKALNAGLPNLLKHIENVTSVYGLPAVVAINRFPVDTDGEIDLIKRKCAEFGVNVAISEVWQKGGEGGIDLAEEVLRIVDEPNSFNYVYPLDMPLIEKIDTIVRRVYGGSGVTYAVAAEKELSRLEGAGYGKLPVCIAKTQYSLTDEPKILGRPKDFEIHVSQARLCAAAGFVVIQTGDVMTMPGLPRIPTAEDIDIDENGTISGLF